jgi:hypothetical protein
MSKTHGQTRKYTLESHVNGNGIDTTPWEKYLSKLRTDKNYIYGKYDSCLNYLEDYQWKL